VRPAAGRREPVLAAAGGPARCRPRAGRGRRCAQAGAPRHRCAARVVTSGARARLLQRVAQEVALGELEHHARARRARRAALRRRRRARAAGAGAGRARGDGDAPAAGLRQARQQLQAGRPRTVRRTHALAAEDNPPNPKGARLACCHVTSDTARGLWLHSVLCLAGARRRLAAHRRVCETHAARMTMRDYRRSADPGGRGRARARLQ